LPLTIKDVAKRAGVAQSTVSLVINEKRHVSPATREKVLKAIRELGYHPRRVARVLASRRTGNIGFILSDRYFYQAEPFYTRIFLGTEFEARKYSYYVLLTTVGEGFSPRKSIPRFLVETNVDGVILTGKISDSLIYYIGDLGLPMVLVDYFPKDSKFPAVLIDNLHGAYEAVGHLIRLGHRRIGFIGAPIDHPSISDRLKGYEQALDESGLPRTDQLVAKDQSDSSVAGGYAAAKRLLRSSSPPTAVFATNDSMAMGAIKAAREIGLGVPDDLAIVGFDDIEVASHTHPPLTTMRVPKEEMGALAVRKIVERIETGGRPSEKTLIAVELVIRGSCGAKKI
jgi:LacI family transcriptional regulator